MKVEQRRKYCPPTINIIYTIQDNKIKRFMAGASIGLTPAKPLALTESILSEMQKKVAESIEGEKYEDIQTSEYCPNRTRITGVHQVLEKLLRIGAVRSTNVFH